MLICTPLRSGVADYVIFLSTSYAIIFGDLVYAFGLDVLLVKAKTKMK